MAGFLHAAETCRVFRRTRGIKTLGTICPWFSHSYSKPPHCNQQPGTQARHGPSLVFASIDFFPGKQGVSCLTPSALLLAKGLATFLALADDALRGLV